MTYNFTMQNLRLSAAALRGSGTTRKEKGTRGNRSTRVPEILATAAKLFARDGYSAFTLRRVADEAGIGLSTLQHYFPTREELLSRTLAAFVEHYGELFRAATANTEEPPEARLRAMLEVGLEELTKPTVADFWIEVWAMSRDHAFAKQFATAAYEQGANLIAGLIAEIHPLLAARECKLRARMLALQFEGLMVLASRYRGGAELTGAIVAAKAICWAVVGAAA
jgi:AcrR family transcriptional regulator